MNVKLLFFILVTIPFNVLLADSWQAEMVDYGIYDTVKGEKVGSDRAAGGLQVVIAKTLKEATNIIPAKLGTSFGFRYTIKGPNDTVKVHIKMTHPGALRDPKSNQEFSVSEWDQVVPANQVNWNTGWTFEHKWEILPGEWQLQLYADSKLLLEKTFIVKLN